jgi:hypothetical protein
MEDKLAYIGRSLNSRTYAAGENMSRAFETAMRQNSSAGILASGSTFIAFETIMLQAYDETVSEAARFVFNYTESNGADVAEHLAFFARRVRDITLEVSPAAFLRS